MAIDYFQIKEKDFDLVSQIAALESDCYDESSALESFDLISLLRHSRVYVAVENENVIGYIFFTKDFDNPETAFLHSINVVDPESYPNLGISLMNITFGDLANYGIKNIEVNVYSDNVNALSKYQHQLGFNVCERLDNEIFEGDEIVILRKEL